MANLEKQTDEILVLQSIFDGRFRLLNGNDQYEISIDFDLNEPFYIRCNDKTAIVRRLPPFTLIIHYHDEYPSDYPPSFVLSCFYFSKSSLQNLCQKLDNYAFVKGEVCVFDWIELIRREIANELVLDKGFGEQINDPRALNGYLADNIAHIYQYLINYNAEKEEQQFRNQLQTCLICTDMISGTDCIRLYRCGHFYCQPCLNNYVQLTFNNGHFGDQVHCPQSQCQKALLPNEIKAILQDERLYERYERITLQRALQAMEDVIWCPRCQSAVLTGGKDDTLCVCHQCHFTFCKKCKELFHFQTMCPKDYIMEQMLLKKQKEMERLQREAEEKRERIRKIQEGDLAVAATLEERALAQKAIMDKKKITEAKQRVAKQPYREIVVNLAEEDQLLETILNAERVEALNTQLCPHCHVRIEKNGGCTHMRCANCYRDFTWENGEGARDPQIASLLYQFPSASSVGSIKEDLIQQSVQHSQRVDENQPQEGERKEETKFVINNKSLIGAAIVQRVKPCPNTSCKKFNVKIGEDNWIVCTGCMKQFCFSCLQSINGAQHFQRKCDRYTPFPN
ncbi:unnamed protein product [Adineta ricciae]|uniref:RBR-type E3 ubiquitin transferase n=1 Tax=Adineta ricciae TaxID=249248 RepID=A0A814TNJ7_ADIRI|nr:unnamed protein product [Adineta ricciae]CAF1173671.1 unnamed protein product [Adineta ricciae]